MVLFIFKGKLKAVFRRVAQIVFHFGREVDNLQSDALPLSCTPQEKDDLD